MSEPTFNWNEEQKSAIQNVSDWVRSSSGPRSMSLTGAAGTGKTTVLSAIKPALQERGNVSFCAATGKAALRLMQCIGTQATTLHSQLYGRPKHGKGGRLLFETINMEKRPDVLVIDESSMLTPKIMTDLKLWTDLGTKVLYVGDPFQLPPVMNPDEEKAYGADFSIFAYVGGPTLLRVMRSDDDVIRVATMLRETNRIPFESGGTYTFKRASLPDKMAVRDYLADQEDHALITWRNQLRMSANHDIRKSLGHTLLVPQPGEPIMICKNGVDVMNGEIHTTKLFSPGPALGTMNTFWLNTDKGQRLLTSVDGREQKFDGMLPFLKDWHAYRHALKAGSHAEPIPVTYGYVFTAHKAQGSEFRRVTVFLSAADMENKHFRKPTKLPNGQDMAFATRWLYTALTRAKTHLTLILGE